MPEVPQWDKNTLMAKSEVALAVLLEKLDDITQQCDQYQYAGGGPLMDDAKFQVSPGASARRVVAHQERRIRLPSHIHGRYACSGGPGYSRSSCTHTSRSGCGCGRRLSPPHGIEYA